MRLVFPGPVPSGIFFEFGFFGKGSHGVRISSAAEAVSGGSSCAETLDELIFE